MNKKGGQLLECLTKDNEIEHCNMKKKTVTWNADKQAFK